MVNFIMGIFFARKMNDFFLLLPFFEEIIEKKNQIYKIYQKKNK